MFNRLLESNKKRQRRLGGAVASTILHTTLIAVAVRATQLTAAPTPKIVALPKVIYRIDPRPPQPTVAPPGAHTNSASERSIVPPPMPSPAVRMVFDLPGIPDPGTATSSSRDFDPTPVARPADGPGGPNDKLRGDEPVEERYVDKPILAIPGTGNPRYPAMLQSAGLEGDVRAQFVVDTLGRVERGSVRVLDTTHELFAAAVREALTRAKFKPAEAGGHLVRQLAEQTFTFRITR